MRIRIYYKDNGTVTGVIIIGSDEWNILEVHNDKSEQSDNYATFCLTEKKVTDCMTFTDEVCLESNIIKQFKGKL
jgi:hypothetical protein